ncbi:MAG: hypothetical protein WCO26_25310 [Deltaproteobacteria bacterium]
MIKQSQFCSQEMIKSNTLGRHQQVKSTFANLPPSVASKLDTALQKVLNQAAEPVPATEEAVKVWGQLYGSFLTEEQLDSVVAYNKSSIGLKDIESESIKDEGNWA